jgi:hypothetical protein
MDIDTDNDWGASFTQTDQRIRDLQVEMEMDTEVDENESVVDKLTRLWMNERHAPTLLAPNQALLSSVLDHIHRQVCLRLIVHVCMQEITD